jgi:serine/threonine-protein kinase
MRNARKLNEPIPPRIVAAIMCGVLLGLHAAHDTKAIGGELLGVVHRDVSPQNVIVGLDGTARVLDFGIAKAAGRAQVTREGQIKGKLAYMAPEQIRGQVDRRTDVFAAAVVLWEMLTGRRLHEGAKDVEIVTRVVEGKFPPPSTFAPELPPEVDEIVMRALARDPAARYGSARELARARERNFGQGAPSEVSAWVEHLAHDVLEKRSDLVRAMELAAGELVALATHPPPVSLALPEEVVSWPGDIPVDFGGELSETSAMFAHSQTSTDASQDAHRTSRHPAIGAWGIVAVSCLLALIGIALGAYALLHRSPRETLVPPSGTSHSDHATGSAASPPPSGSASAALVEAPSADVEPKPPAAIATAATETTATAAPPTSAPAAALPRPSQGGPAVVPVPAPVPKKPPPSKPVCDPPYTVDDVGHRHYKPECMGLD